MPLSPHEVKQRLGYGAQRLIADALQVSQGHVSQVLSGLRTDRRIARHVARKLQVKLTELPTRYHTDNRLTSQESAA